MSEAQKYEGSCHCGAVKFDVTMEPPKVAIACNCSMCGRMGWLLAFAKEGDFQFHHAPDAVTDYQFNQKKTHHYFCKTCGCRAYSRGTDPQGKDTLAINLRCVSGVDVSKLEVQSFDGASL